MSGATLPRTVSPAGAVTLPRLSLICLLVLPLPAQAAGAAENSGLNTGPVRPVRAASAESFLSSLGVNIHIDQGYDAKNYIAPLRYLGVRAVRDGIRHVDSEVMLAQATGVRFVIQGGGNLSGELASARILAQAHALLALEGPNEPNNFAITYQGKQGGHDHGWEPVAAFQEALYSAVKADPALKAYPVFGVSETGAQPTDLGLQFRTTPANFKGAVPPGTHFADFLNVHNYVSGVHGGYGNNQAWQAADPTLDGRWDGLWGNCGVTWLRRFRGYDAAAIVHEPRVTTETGWDSVSDTGGEAVQAAVLSNTYLAQFRRGWRYTFIYELEDNEGGSGHQGLFDGARPKMAATYIHNLTTILADQGTLPHPGSLSFTIGTKSKTVHDLLLQKSDGEFDLVVWDERRDGTDDVTVTFARPQKKVEVFDIAQGTEPRSSEQHARHIALQLSNHAVILRIPAPGAHKKPAHKKP
ncbi:MAG TPA: hypothetical protein VL752_02375 [Acidisoma sp.]|uniref:hypothetical protein n=1 Tax=Acidisoma sp. TaxID=1872115 RepID=UPI002C49D7A3|nr:hypothetical protein [Acidisoma sp.]HTH99767.1 hypothetical protein [Acidisoma sp.]